MNYRIWLGIIFSTIYLFSNFNPLYSSEGKKNFADVLFEDGDYLRAIGEYQRMAYFSNDSDSVALYQFQMGECYRKLNDFKKAKNIYDKLITKDIKTPELEKDLIIASAKCLINIGALTSARLMLSELKKVEQSSDTVNYLSGITYLKERRWDEAEGEFDKIVSASLRKDALQMLRKISTQHFKSPKIALVLSTIIPGAGQIYASKPLKGIIAFSLNLSLGYLTYKAGKEDRKMDAFLIVYFGLQRFYIGNLEQARKYSIEHNQKILDNIRVE